MALSDLFLASAVGEERAHAEPLGGFRVLASPGSLLSPPTPWFGRGLQSSVGALCSGAAAVGAD